MIAEADEAGAVSIHDMDFTVAIMVGVPKSCRANSGSRHLTEGGFFRNDIDFLVQIRLFSVVTGVGLVEADDTCCFQCLVWGQTLNRPRT